MNLRNLRTCAKPFLLPAAAIAAILAASMAEAAETIEIVSPAPPHFAGQPLVFQIRLREFVQPRRATVFHRPVGAARYRKLPLARETEIEFRGALPARRSVPPGIEYFISVEDGNGRVFTLPALDPGKNPFRIDISLDRKPPQIRTSSPAAGEAIETVRPMVELSVTDEGAGLDPGSMRLVLDGVDVTGLASVKDNRVRFIPGINLLPGQHRLVVDLADAAGNLMPPQEIVFTVVPPPEEAAIAGLDRASADVYWDAETNLGLAGPTDTAFSEWRLQSSVMVRSEAEKDKVKTSLDAHVWYSDEEKSDTDETWNLNNLLASLSYDERLFLDMGDVTVESTDLIGKTLNRRGGRLGFDANGTEAQAFMVRSNAVTGFDHVLGGGDENQQIWGGAVAKDLFGGEMLVLRADYLTGKNYNPDDYNASTLQPGSEGDIFSLSFSSRLIGETLQIEGEYAGSRFDSDISDNHQEEADHAWRARAFGRMDRTDWEAGYRFFGPDFASIANPLGTRNREEINVGGGIRFDESSLRASLLHGRDNVEKDPLLPVIHNTTGMVTYNLTPAERPAVFASASQTLQESFEEPAGFPEIENTTSALTLGASQAAERWYLSPSYSFIRFDDRSAFFENDSDTHVLTAAGGIRPTDLASVNPSVTYTHTELKSTGVAIRTWQAALSGVAGFRQNEMNVNATISWLDNQTSDGTIHTDTWSGIVQLNWSVEKYILGRGKQTLSLRGQYNLNDDRISDGDSEDYIVYLVLSFGMPFTYDQ
jgi:hypothetical protein